LSSCCNAGDADLATACVGQGADACFQGGACGDDIIYEQQIPAGYFT
jgi:hypothetical protein